MSLLYLRNGNSWAYTFQMNMALGLVQTIIAGIGIVLTVPVASWLAAYFGTRKLQQAAMSAHELPQTKEDQQWAH